MLTSGSIPTLLALALLAAVLFALYGFLEFVRSRLLVRVGRIVDETLRERVFDAVAVQALRGGGGTRSEALGDLQTIRQFLQGNGPLAFLDMPWAPIYLAVIFLMHSLLGYMAAFAAAIVLTVIAILTERTTRKHAAETHKAFSKRAFWRINAVATLKRRPYSAWSAACASAGPAHKIRRLPATCWRATEADCWQACRAR